MGLAEVQGSAGALCDSFLLSGLRGVSPVGLWLSLFRNVEPLIVGGLLLTGVWGVLLTVSGLFHRDHREERWSEGDVGHRRGMPG